MDILGAIMNYGGGVVVLVCLIIVWIRMFQNGQTGLAIAFIVLSCCGIGALATFIYGWMKSKEWNLQTIMLVCTIGWIVSIVGGIISPKAIPYKFDQAPIQRQP